LAFRDLGNTHPGRKAAEAHRERPLDDREEGLDGREGPMDGREAGLDDREGTLDASRAPSR
jgi:hypothetical protein